MKHVLGYWNSKRVLNFITVVLLLISAIGLGFAKPVAAAEPPDQTINFPAGLVCDFELQVDVWGSSTVQKEFTDKNGNVRMLFAGRGSDLLFTNLSTGATFSLDASGAVTKITIHPDGSQLLTLSGSNVVFLFPTDIPAGPSTTLYVGRAVITVDTNGVWTVGQTSGGKTDICAALSH